VRRGGTLSISGVYGGLIPAWNIGELFDRQITIRMGQANVRRWTDDILPLLQDGDPLDARGLVTHVVPLDGAAEWYRAFRDKQDAAVKVVFRV
jgi:threonine dehydrogenase-like Zn-dependent dehydrogenase